MTNQAIRKNTANAKGTEKVKKYLSQTDVPMYTLEQALRVPRAILDEHAGKPTKPLDVAQAMNVQPGSGPFRSLCGAAIAYGLTEGGYNADTIIVTELGRRIVTNTLEDPDGLPARREASLKPRVLREFLQKYDGSKMPREDVALKVLEGMHVPQEALKRVLNLIAETAKSAGFFKQITGVQYIDLKQTVVTPQEASETAETSEDELARGSGTDIPVQQSLSQPEAQTKKGSAAEGSGNSDVRQRRVFVTHGKNRELIPQLKELLQFGQLEPIVSVERESVSKPVPDKVLDDMRSCGAAIIHVDADREVIANDGNKEVILNGNVLIEIGAAMALFGRRFVLLVHEGIRLPSNLQGLYEVRYSGEKLDGEATLRLLKVFNELKSAPVANLAQALRE